MVFIVNNKSLVVQSNRLVEAKYRLSVEEQKIVKILISQIQRDDVDFQEYEFRVKELAALLGMEHKDTYRVLPRITERLMSRVLKFYNPETETLLQTSWLSSAEYKKGQGTVAMCFDPKLKPLLLQLQSYFTKYELGQVMQFKGQYTIRFFELQKSFLGRNKREVYFSLNELWEILGLRKDEYKVFFNFKIRVLESSRLELLEKTGQSFSWEPVRQGKGGKVVGVRIIFDEGSEEGDTTVAMIGSQPPPQPETEPKRDAPAPPEPPTSQEEPVWEPNNASAGRLLVDCGVSPPVAEELAAAYEEPYIREKIALLTAHVGPVKSRAGFLVKALHEDWKDPEIEEKKRLEERRDIERAEAERTKRLRAIRETFDLHRKNHALHHYQQVPESTRAIWRSEFLATLTPILKKRYASLPTFGFEDPYYRAFVMQYKLASLDLEDYLVQTGLSLDPEDRRVLGAL
jgi:hypothetical protein